MATALWLRGAFIRARPTSLARSLPRVSLSTSTQPPSSSEGESKQSKFRINDDEPAAAPSSKSDKFRIDDADLPPPPEDIPEDDEPAAKYKRKAWKRYVAGGLGLACVGLTGTLVFQHWDKFDYRNISIESVTNAAKESFDDSVNYFAAPSKKDLLPDSPAMPAGVTQRTLVLGLEETLVHTEWDRTHGHRTKRRPGVDAFLACMSQWYEIVVFTSALNSYADPIIDQLDPVGYVAHRIYRDGTDFRDGKHIKDVAFLNRDLKQTILIDCDPHSAGIHPENAILVRPWVDDPKDMDLMDLVPLLQSMALDECQDVRPALKLWQGQHVPTKFRELNTEYLKRKREGRLPLQWGGFGATSGPTGGPFCLIQGPPQQAPAPVAAPPPPPPPKTEKKAVSGTTSGLGALGFSKWGSKPQA